jgi:hypothetical protein
MSRRAPMLVALALVASAAQALPSNEICYSAEFTVAASQPTNATVFSCPIAGDGTLPQLAERGFRVVKLSPLAVDGGLRIRHQLVVKRTVRVFDSGFEP